MTSQAPTPNMAICRHSRKNRDTAVMPPLRPLARAWRSSIQAFSRCQRRTTLGIMPMASMTSALRTADSAKRNDLIDAPPDIIRSLRVASSLSSASANSRVAPATDSQPSSG